MADKKFFITDPDREWVHHCFEWLTKSYGYPHKGFKPILFSKEFFPDTLSHSQTNIPDLLNDLCKLFDIDPSIVSYEIETDISDNYGTPYSLQGPHSGCEIEYTRKGEGYHYKLVFAKSLIKLPRTLLFYSVFKFIQIKLSMGDIGWIETDDHYFLFYLIGIYKGWGVILAQTMTDIGQNNDGFWQRTWNYISPMPIPVMAYSLALHSAMLEDTDPVWKSYLSAEMQMQFERASEYIKHNPSPVVSKQELTAKNLYHESFKQSRNQDLNQSIESCQKALFLTNDEHLKSHLHNKIGYNSLLKGEFQRAILSFQKALSVNPNVMYVYENLSFAFVMLGDTDTAKYYHTLAAQGKRVPAYSYRNLAIYHQKRGEIELAQKNFQLAFEHITIPVDWLEYLYARFLFEQGDKEEALMYLQIAADKGEHFAIQWMEELNSKMS